MQATVFFLPIVVTWRDEWGCSSQGILNFYCNAVWISSFAKFDGI